MQIKKDSPTGNLFYNTNINLKNIQNYISKPPSHNSTSDISTSSSQATAHPSQSTFTRLKKIYLLASHIQEKLLITVLHHKSS